MTIWAVTLSFSCDKWQVLANRQTDCGQQSSETVTLSLIRAHRWAGGRGRERSGENCCSPEKNTFWAGVPKKLGTTLHSRAISLYQLLSIHSSSRTAALPVKGRLSSMAIVVEGRQQYRHWLLRYCHYPLPSINNNLRHHPQFSFRHPHTQKKKKKTQSLSYLPTFSPQFFYLFSLQRQFVHRRSNWNWRQKERMSAAAAAKSGEKERRRSHWEAEEVIIFCCSVDCGDKYGLQQPKVIVTGS